MPLVNPLAVTTNTYHGYPLEAALRGIRQAGFTAVEIAAVRGWSEHLAPDASPDEIARLRALLDQHGLRAVSLSGHSDLTTDAGVAQFLNALETAVRLGIPIVNTGIGGHAGGGEDERAFLARIGRVAEAAAARGIVVALETHGSILGTGAQGAALLARIGHPALRLNYDTANVIYYAGVRPEEDLVHALPYLAHVHLKDKIGGPGVWNFPPLGQGEIDFPRILRTLRDGGYTGPLSVEIEFQGEPWPPLPEVDRAVQASYAYLQRVIAEIG